MVVPISTALNLGELQSGETNTKSNVVPRTRDSKFTSLIRPVSSRNVASILGDGLTKLKKSIQNHLLRLISPHVSPCVYLEFVSGHGASIVLGQIVVMSHRTEHPQQQRTGLKPLLDNLFAFSITYFQVCASYLKKLTFTI